MRSSGVLVEVMRTKNSNGSNGRIGVNSAVITNYYNRWLPSKDLRSAFDMLAMQTLPDNTTGVKQTTVVD